MPLNVIACIKQTPATGAIQLDQKGEIVTSAMTYGISPLDEYALEEALRIKERVPGSWTAALTMGPAKAQEILRESIARGCDAVYHLSDDAFEGSDTYATSYILSQGIRKIIAEKGKVDLVICAKQASDGETGQVGPAIAAWLDWPNVSFVKKIEETTDKIIRVVRMMEDGQDVVEMALPALISVVKEIAEPRLPSLKGKMAAKKAVIPTWKAADISADAAKIGPGGSPTVILKKELPPKRSGGMKIDGATAQEKARKLVEKMKELKLL
ncbi:MAG: electron transfer flavoprotein subunit beta/FixA family protein [Elusimicrobia bacterium]|nr:electron transfer flavoprotein subunit beta/FixA family protein [Elusimicrobiota bacterium]